MTQVRNGLSWLFPFLQSKFFFLRAKKQRHRSSAPRSPRDHADPPLSHREEAAEKRPVAAKCEPEILGRDIISAIPLALEFRSFSREHLSQALHGSCDETICLLYCLSRLVNKTHLDGIPPCAKIFRFLWRKERRCLLVKSRSGCSSCGRSAANGKARHSNSSRLWSHAGTGQSRSRRSYFRRFVFN